MFIVNALNHYMNCDEFNVGGLVGLDHNKLLDLVDDFKSFALNYPEED